MIQALLEATKYLSVYYTALKSNLQLFESTPSAHLLNQATSYCTISVMDGSATDIYYNPNN